MLRGEELLKILKQNPKMSYQELALAAGYYLLDENGNKIPNTIAMLNAIIEYKINKKYEPKRGAKPKYQIKVHKDNKIILGKSYLEQAGFRPGMVINVIILDQGKIVLQVQKHRNPPKKLLDK